LGLTGTLGLGAWQAGVQLSAVREDAAQMLAAARFGGGLAAFRTERRFTLAALDSAGGDVLRDRIEAARRSADAMTMAGPSLLAMLPAGDEARRFERFLQDLPNWRAAAGPRRIMRLRDRHGARHRGGSRCLAQAPSPGRGPDASLMQRAEILGTA